MLDGHGFCENNNEDDLADLRGLDHDRQAEVEPAFVAAALNTEEAEQGDEKNAENQQQLTAFGDDIHVDQREEHIQCNAKQKRHKLDEDVAAVSGVVRSAGDDDNAVDRCRDAKRQQKHVRFFNEFADGAENALHRRPPFRDTCRAGAAGRRFVFTL